MSGGGPGGEQRLILGDCLDVFRDVSGLGAIVADPPAGIGFMGRSWDKDRGGRAAWVAYWAERFAVARDACVDEAVALVWALPRTSHWTATALEDGGWFIRDVITHHFGQGWPKDKHALKPASEHWILATKTRGRMGLDIDACRVERGGEARAGHKAGKGSMFIADAYQPGDMAKHMRTDGSWPTNALLSHAEGCERVGVRRVKGTNPPGANGGIPRGTRKFHVGINGRDDFTSYEAQDGTESIPAYRCLVGCDCGASWLALAGGSAPRCAACGRVGWWACPVAEMDAQSGESTSRTGNKNAYQGDGYGGNLRPQLGETGHADSGGASRFFPRFGYHAKAPSGERHAGCEQLYWRAEKSDPFGFVRVTREEWEALSGAAHSSTYGQDNRRESKGERAHGNVHPTVKRLALMRWLHALTGATRIGDLCGGSGSGMVAAYLDGIDWIGAEVCPQAIEIAEARLAFWRGCSPTAIARFLADDEVPTPREEPAAAQRSLFDAPLTERRAS